MKQSKQKTRLFYNTVYYQKISLKEKINNHFYKLIFMVNIKKQQKVLDIACGTGEWLKVVEMFGGLPFGVDISEKAIRVSKGWIQNGNFAVGDSESLPYIDHSFDVVCCLGALEHFEDQQIALKEMIRVAKKNAPLLILVPNSKFLTYRLGLFKGTKQTEIKETILSLEEWECLFKESGLIIDNKWKDLHVLSAEWIIRKPVWMVPFRFIQAILLIFWPLSWQYQVYHLCHHKQN